MLKVAIIGSGFGVVGLLPAFASLRRCQIMAVCAKETKSLVKLQKIHNFTLYRDWRALFDNENIDAVALAVPPRAQYEIAKVAIRRSMHVFAEKPLAANISQAKELYFLAKKAKIVHGIDFIFPEIAAWRKVKEMLQSRELGSLQNVSVHWEFLSGDIKNKKTSWKTDVAEGGGALAFYFSHGLYYLEHLIGKIKKTRALFTYSSEAKNGGEVGVDMLMQFANGIAGHVHVSSISRGIIKHQMVLQCEDGVIVLENENAVVDNFSVTVYTERGIKNIRVVKDKSRSGEDERVKIVEKLAARFVAACLYGKEMSPSFRDGMRVQELIEAIRNSSL